MCLDEAINSYESTDSEAKSFRVLSNHNMEQDVTTRLVPKARHNALVNGLCPSCYRKVSCFLSQPMAAANLEKLEPYRISDIHMRSKKSSCSLCNFLSSMVYSAASHEAISPGMQSECSLHVSTFSEIFFDAKDRQWFFSGDPTVFYISPLYLSRSRAAEWALRHNTCFMPRSDGSSGIFARELSPQADLGVIREWVEFCNRGHTHPDCNPPGALCLPGFQVIDCELRTLVTWPGPALYVTLSYVWGNDTAEDPESDGRLPAILPRLIEDAINVSSFLGFRYLWIDRYCIPQDDEEAKTFFIRNMDKIYSESALTIIASASERPSEGLAGVGVDRTDLPGSCRMGDLSLTQIFTNLADEVEKSRWNTRGWTYQEAFLSNRRLVFTKSQCYFQCGELWCTDGIRVPLDTLPRLNRSGQSKLSQVFPWVTTSDRAVLDSAQLNRRKQREEYFVERVREYMRRELGHDRDGFNAFAGVLNYLKWFSGEFLLGDIVGLPIWNIDPSSSVDGDGLDALLQSLAWGLTKPYNPRAILSDAVERRKELPSWTWCGWKLSIPSTRRIEWSEGWSSQDSDISPPTEIGFEFENGEVIQRRPTCNLAGLLKMTDERGSVKVLLVRGWLSKLLVPASCWRTNYDEECQCGPYRLARKDVRYLSTMAARRGVTLTEQGYVLKAWFFSPLVFNVAEDKCRGEVMILVESTETGTYERLDILCQIKMEYFIGHPSLEDMAWRMNWELTDFKIS